MSLALLLPDSEQKTPAEIREAIVKLEAHLMAMPPANDGQAGQIAIKTTHRFAPGVYVREIFIPKGSILVGKINKTEHLSMMVSGDITVCTENGKARLNGWNVFTTKPGLQRVGCAHEDTVWITIHRNPDEESNIDTLEERLFAKTYEDAVDTRLVTYLASKKTYDDAIGCHGFTHEQVLTMSENDSDQVPFPNYVTGVRVSKSPIHGSGMFSTRRFERGEIIAPARIERNRTPAGRYCNHSGDPNAEMVIRQTGQVDLVALKTIDSGEEILNDYFFSFASTRHSPSITYQGHGLAEIQITGGVDS